MNLETHHRSPTQRRMAAYYTSISQLVKMLKSNNPC